MTTRPPRASTKGDGKRPKTRGSTQAEKPDRPDRPDKPSKRRSSSVIPTDQFERVRDEEVVEVTELPEVTQLRMLVLEAAAHLAAAQGAVTLAGHVVVGGATSPGGVEKLRGSVAGTDALLVALPGGEPLIDLALGYGPDRPVVIAACTSGAVEAARRAAAAGADLVAVRPHDVERLAPILLAAARLVEQRRQLTSALLAMAAPEGLGGAEGREGPLGAPGGAGTVGHDRRVPRAGSAELDDLSEREPGALQPFEVWKAAVELELERAGRYAYPLAIAMFSVDVAPPPPPPGVKGILRARAGNALVNAIRDVDLVTEIEQDRFLVLLPYTDRIIGAEVARRIIGAVAAADPVVTAGRTFTPKVIGAVADARPDEPPSFDALLHDVTQLLEQAVETGASLAVGT